MSSIEDLTNIEKRPSQTKMDTSEVVEKLKQMGLSLASTEDGSNIESESSSQQSDTMLECPICKTDAYNSKTGCCEICGHDGLVWEDSQYDDFFEYEFIEKGEDDEDDSFGDEYRITEVTDPLCPVPNPFIIPEEYAWDSITELGDDLFYDDQRLISVVIPKTIEIIGSDAFRECRSLEKLTILGGTYISSGAFEDCCRLQDVYMSDNVVILGYHAFYGCTSLQTIIIPKSVERIGPFAFSCCSNLRSVVILNPEITIESTAFYNCPNISEVTIPLSLASRIDTLFGDSENIKRITWVEQTITPYEEKAVNVCFRNLTQDSYTSGETGWTVKFSLENNDDCSTIVSVIDVFLISEGKIQPCDSWLQGYQIKERRLFPQETAEVAAIFLSDNYNSRNFERGALIGLKLAVSDNAHDEIDTEEMLEMYQTNGYGDYSDLNNVPNDGPFTVAFRNLDDSWHLVATDIPEKSYKTDVNEIEFANFVVRTNTFNCNLNHSVETVEAVVSILAEDGSIFKTSTMAGYCRHCDCYFILEADFIALQRKGKLLCQLLSWEEYRTKGQAIFNGEDMKAESVLKRCGYTVNATDNLSAVQRQKILSLVLDNGLYTETELCNFLDWLINYHGRSKTRNMSAAISKWSEDRLFVLTHNWSDRRKIGVGSIKYKK